MPSSLTIADYRNSFLIIFLSLIFLFFWFVFFTLPDKSTALVNVSLLIRTLQWLPVTNKGKMKLIRVAFKAFQDLQTLPFLPLFNIEKTVPYSLNLSYLFPCPGLGHTVCYIKKKKKKVLFSFLSKTMYQTLPSSLCSLLLLFRACLLSLMFSCSCSLLPWKFDSQLQWSTSILCLFLWCLQKNLLVLGIYINVFLKLCKYCLSYFKGVFLGLASFLYLSKNSAHFVFVFTEFYTRSLLISHEMYPGSQRFSPFFLNVL